MGAGADERVAVCLERTPDAVAAILGALKAGAGYVPLDPAHPSARLATVLADARPVAVVTSSAVVDRLPADLPTLVLDARTGEIDGECSENLRISIHPKSLMYVLYTSGSTGTPKGVMIEH